MLRIRYLRERAGLSQLELARRAGVSPAVLCRWERNQIDPRASILPRIASALGVTVDELFETVEGEVVETGDGQSPSQPEGLTAPFTQGSRFEVEGERQ